MIRILMVTIRTTFELLCQQLSEHAGHETIKGLECRSRQDDHLIPPLELLHAPLLRGVF